MTTASQHPRQSTYFLGVPCLQFHTACWACSLQAYIRQAEVAHKQTAGCAKQASERTSLIFLGNNRVNDFGGSLATLRAPGNFEISGWCYTQTVTPTWYAFDLLIHIDSGIARFRDRFNHPLDVVHILLHGSQVSPRRIHDLAVLIAAVVCRTYG